MQPVSADDDLWSLLSEFILNYNLDAKPKARARSRSLHMVPCPRPFSQRFGLNDSRRIE